MFILWCSVHSRSIYLEFKLDSKLDMSTIPEVNQAHDLLPICIHRRIAYLICIFASELHCVAIALID